MGRFDSSPFPLTQGFLMSAQLKCRPDHSLCLWLSCVSHVFRKLWAQHVNSSSKSLPVWTTQNVSTCVKCPNLLQFDLNLDFSYFQSHKALHKRPPSALISDHGFLHVLCFLLDCALFWVGTVLFVSVSTRSSVTQRGDSSH